MKRDFNNMRRSTKVTTALLVVLFAAGAHWGCADSSQGQDSEQVVRQSTTFGTLGFVDGQTVRLSAVRAGDDAARICHVDLNFFDINGNQQGTGVSEDLRLGSAAFLDLSRADVDPQPTEPRAQIYAVVEVASEPVGSDPKPACHVAMSIEIVDQLDGRTQIYQGAFTVGTHQGDKVCCICCETTNGNCTCSACGKSVSTGAPKCPKVPGDCRCRG